MRNVWLKEKFCTYSTKVILNIWQHIGNRKLGVQNKMCN